MFVILVAQLLLGTQMPDASVTGTIRDVSSGLPLVAASVALSGAERDVLTDENGRFVVSPAPFGTHHLTIRCLGYATRSLDVLIPRSGNVAIDVTLEPVATRLARVDVVQSQTSADARSVDRRAEIVNRSVTVSSLVRHPLLAEPDVLRATSGGDVFARPETAGGLFIRGGSADQVAYSIDGIPVFNVAHLGGLLGAWNTDALSAAHLSADASDIRAGAVLSGSLDVVTRAPAGAFGLRSALSTSHLRITADGPLAETGAAYLLSMRQAVPTIGAARDPNLIRGESSDWLGKVTLPVRRDEVQVIGYGSGDEFSSSRAVAPHISADPRNGFAWESRSIGASWMRASATSNLRATAWQSSTRAIGDWSVSTTDSHLDSRRTDYGVQFVRQPLLAHSGSLLGARVEMVRTTYRSRGTKSTESGGLRLDAVAPVATLSGERVAALTSRMSASIGAALSVTRSGAMMAPRARVEWRPTATLALAAAASRSVQHVQSLRNTESIVGHMFPVDLFVASTPAGVPTAHSDQASLTAEMRPVAGMTLALRGYARSMQGILLTAERESGPFVITANRAAPFFAGSASVVGAATEFRYASARTSALLAYGWQRARYDLTRTAYAPEHAARHRLHAGVTVEVLEGLQLRLGGIGAFGRRATAVRGAVEWDGCNLADRACEFAGVPMSSPDALGALSLPHYLSADVGVRKQWLRIVRDHASTIAAYGTVTNLFNRTNFLNSVVNDGGRSGVEMRSRTPLVIGLEWQF